MKKGKIKMVLNREERADLSLQLNFQTTARTRYANKIRGVVNLGRGITDKKELEQVIDAIEQAVHQSLDITYKQVLTQKKQNDVMGQHMKITYGVPTKNYSVEVFDLIHSNLRGYIQSNLNGRIQDVKSVDIDMSGIRVFNQSISKTDDLDGLFVFCLSYDSYSTHLIHDISVIQASHKE